MFPFFIRAKSIQDTCSEDSEWQVGCVEVDGGAVDRGVRDPRWSVI